MRVAFEGDSHLKAADPVELAFALDTVLVERERIIRFWVVGLPRVLGSGELTGVATKFRRRELGSPTRPHHGRRTPNHARAWFIESAPRPTA